PGFGGGFGRRFRFGFGFDRFRCFFGSRFRRGRRARRADGRGAWPFAAFFEAVFLRGGLERTERGGGARFGRGQSRFVTALGGEFDFALGGCQFVGGAAEFGVAGGFLRRAEPLEALHHAAVEVGHLARFVAGFAAARPDRADRGVDLGADRVALFD